MKNYNFRVLTVQDIPSMSALSIERQTLEASTYPFLNNSSLNEKHLTERLSELLNKSNETGLGIFKDNELIGYIIGQVKLDTLRGRHIWVSYEGIALKSGHSFELLRKLYEKVSVLWLEQGCFTHYMVIPLGSTVYLEALQGLSFSIQQVHGVMKTADYVPFKVDSVIKVRRADRTDREVMGQMSNLINAYQNAAPTFEPAWPERIFDIKEGYKSTVDDEDATIFFALLDKKALGFQAYWPTEPELMAPDNSVELSIAGTYASEMGKGIGKRLMNESILLLTEKGYSTITTDWRITNLSSSTFWPKCGFKPIAYRMVRSIDPNIAWANFDNAFIRDIK